MSLLHAYLTFSAIIFTMSLGTDILDQRYLSVNAGPDLISKPEHIGLLRVIAHIGIGFTPLVNFFAAFLLFHYWRGNL